MQSTSQFRTERFRQIYSLYLEGHSYRSLGRKFGLSGERIRQILQTQSSTKELQVLRDEITRRYETSWQTKEIQALLDSGHTCRAIAELLNVSFYRVKRLSAKYKKQLREQAESNSITA